MKNIHKMTPICNIQMMQDIIGKEKTDFEVLWNMSYDELHNMQNKLIPEYNNTINRKKS